MSVFDNIGCVFRDETLLDINHLPSRDSIIGRDDEIDAVSARVVPVTRGASVRNTLIYGPTGTGKSLVTKFVIEEAKEFVGEAGYDLGVAYVDCDQNGTETRAVRSVCKELLPEDEEFKLPEAGVGTARYYDYLWEIHDNYDATIVVLDEIDKIGRPGQIDDSILMQLSRAQEADKVDTKVGLIGISNKLNYRDKLDNRVKSSFSGSDIVFSEYNGRQLREILRNRRGAFLEGALDESAINLCAALAAQDNGGDAREAIDILRNAGEIAEMNGDSTVTDEHVEVAQEKAQNSRVRDLITGLNYHSQLTARALAELTRRQRDEGVSSSRIEYTDEAGEWFPTVEIIDMYERICDSEAADPRSPSRVRDFIGKLEFLTVFGKAEYNGGSVNSGASGRTNIYRLNHDVEVVLDATHDDEGEDEDESVFERVE